MVGDNILRFRERAGKTRIEFAKKVKTSRGYIFEVEAGLRTPSLQMLQRIASALSEFLNEGVTPADLLTPVDGKANGKKRKAATAGARK